MKVKKRKMPNTLQAQKAFRYGFYGVLAFSTLGASVAFANIGDSPQDTKKEIRQEVKNNFASSIGAQTFSADFAKEFMTWAIGQEENREKRLAPFLLETVDSQAGLKFEGMEWNSKAIQANIWNVKEQGKDKALITVRVKQELSKPAAPGKKAANGGTNFKYLTIPVITDGSGFAVYEQPYYEKETPQPTIVLPVKPEAATVQDIGKVKEIEGFMDTFFKVYSSGKPDELTYYAEGIELQGVQGILEYKTLESVKVLEAKKGNKVEVEVVYKELPSKANVIQKYTLNVQKKQERWVITSLKNY